MMRRKPLLESSILKLLEHREYVEQRNGGFYVAGTRVSLDSIVSCFNAGESPETIRHNLPPSMTRQLWR